MLVVKREIFVWVGLLRLNVLQRGFQCHPQHCYTVLCSSIPREKGRSIEKVTIFSCFQVHVFSAWCRCGCSHLFFSLQAAFLQCAFFISTREGLWELDFLKDKLFDHGDNFFEFSESYYILLLKILELSMEILCCYWLDTTDAVRSPLKFQ